MKIKFLLLILTTLIIGCGPDRYTYQYSTVEYLPDSNKAKYAEWVKNTVSASNFHMTGGDYEDPEDVVDEIKEEGYNLFTVTEDAIIIYNRNSYISQIGKHEMTKSQLQILDSLKNQ